MLKRIINSINCASDAWNQSQYRYSRRENGGFREVSRRVGRAEGEMSLG